MKPGVTRHGSLRAAVKWPESKAEGSSSAVARPHLPMLTCAQFDGYAAGHMREKVRRRAT